MDSSGFVGLFIGRSLLFIFLGILVVIFIRWYWKRVAAPVLDEMTPRKDGEQQTRCTDAQNRT